MDKERFIYLVNQVKIHDEKSLREILDSKEISTMIDKLVNNLSIRNRVIPKSDMQVIAKTEIWRVLDECVIDETYELSSILGFIHSSLKNRIIGFIVREKELKYSKETGYTVKVNKAELKETSAVVSLGDIENLEDIVRTLNIPTSIKHLVIYYLVLQWNYDQIAEVYDCSSSQARNMTINALRLVNKTIGKELIE